MAGVPWTAEQEDVLRQISKMKLENPIQAACKVLRRNRGAIFSKAKQLEISLAPAPPEIDMDEFQKLIKTQKELENPTCI